MNKIQNKETSAPQPTKFGQEIEIVVPIEYESVRQLHGGDVVRRHRAKFVIRVKARDLALDNIERVLATQSARRKIQHGSIIMEIIDAETL